jgi:hypothetical protein
MQKSPANLGTVQGVVNGFRLKKASWTSWNVARDARNR